MHLKQLVRDGYEVIQALSLSALFFFQSALCRQGGIEHRKKYLEIAEGGGSSCTPARGMRLMHICGRRQQTWRSFADQKFS
jgi:hypothetical protein